MTHITKLLDAQKITKETKPLFASVTDILKSISQTSLQLKMHTTGKVHETYICNLRELHQHRHNNGKYNRKLQCTSRERYQGIANKKMAQVMAGEIQA